MSVGICVVNNNGIALAADSAGTLGHNKMFYNSMNKVFSLSNKNIIGGISYGATRIGNASIEQIIKEFREYVDSQDELINKVEDIEKLLVDFIKQKDNYYNFSDFYVEECKGIVISYLCNWKQRIEKGIEATVGNKSDSNSNQPSESDTQTPLDKVLNELEKEVNKYQEEINSGKKVITYDYISCIENDLKDVIDESIIKIYPLLKELPDKINQIKKLLVNYLNYRWNETSVLGLFVAGYGSDSAYPQYIHFQICKVINGNLKYTIIEKDSKTDIIPLAQPDVALTFCTGISRELQEHYMNINQKIINSKIDSLDDSKFSAEQKENLKNLFSDVSIQLNSAIKGVISKYNINPLIEGLSVLPLPEMASLAENLVNMTSLRRKYVLDGNQQTVGGPTDVAVISKGDGFIWIKRKHYFDRELNYQFFESRKNNENN